MILAHVCPIYLNEEKKAHYEQLMTEIDNVLKKEATEQEQAAKGIRAENEEKEKKMGEVISICLEIETVEGVANLFGLHKQL